MAIQVNIFLLCYNEQLLLPYTIKYYKTKFSNCIITIFDNYSTDRSCEIAEQYGCRIKKFNTDDQQDELTLMNVRSHLWKEFVTEGWVIMCDMDEWLDITEEELILEDQKGTTIITTQGFEMVGESKKEDLSDIDLFAIKRGFYSDNMSKRICFKYPDIAIEFWWGAHTCFPYGNSVYSEKVYLMKHYNYLGEEYLIQKYMNRYSRNNLSRQHGINGHYINDVDKIRQHYKDLFIQSIELS
jgi:hypothetical protein